jgi:hypothetical protein
MATSKIPPRLRQVEYGKASFQAAFTPQQKWFRECFVGRLVKQSPTRRLIGQLMRH